MAAEIVIRVVGVDDTHGVFSSTTQGIRDMGSAADEGGRRMGAFGQVAIGAFRALGSVAIDVAMQAGRAFVGLIGDSVNAAGDFQQGMSVLQAASGATDAQMQALSSTAIALGNDMSLPAASGMDAAQAMLELAKAGLSVDDTMAAAKGTLQLAAAAETDAATAAGIVSSALNAFHLEGAQAAQVADLLAAGANASSASMTDLSQGLQQAGFAFHASGQPVDTLVAALAELTNVGLTGSDAGTALKNAMLQMMAPTSQASAVMQQYGINVRDSSGNMLPLRDIIGVLQDKLSGLSPAARDAALKTMLMGDGMKAMIPLLEAGVTGFDAMHTSVTEAGAAQAMAAAQTDGFKGALGGIKNAMETIQLVVGLALLPILTRFLNEGIGPILSQALTLAQALTGDQQVFSQLSPTIQGIVITLQSLGTGISTVVQSLQSGGIAGAFQGLAAGAGDWILTAIPTLLTNFATWRGQLFSQLTESLPGWLATLGQLGAGAGQWLLNALPILLASLGTFFQTLLNQTIIYLPQWAATLIQFGIKATTWIAERLPDLINNLGAFFNRMVTWVVDSLPGWAASLAKLGEKVAGWVLDALPGLAGNLGKATGALLGWIAQTVVDVAPKLLVLAGKFLGWIATDLLPALPGALLKIGTAIFNFITGLAGELAPKLAPLAQKFLDWIKETLPKLPGALAGIATAIFNFIAGAVTDVAPKLAALGKKFIDWIGTEVIPKIGPEMAKINTAINDWINTAISNVATWIVGLAKKFYLWISETVIPNLPGQFAAIGTAISTWINTATTNVGSWIVELAKKLYTWVSETVIPALPGELAKIGTAISDWVSGAIDTVSTSVRGIGEALVDGIKAGVSAAWERFKSWIGGIMASLPEPIQSALNMHSPSLLMADTVGEPIIEGIVLGISRAQPKALSAMLDLAKALIDVVSSGVNAFSQLRQLGTVPMSSVQQFADTLQGALIIFAEMTQRWNREMMSQASQFTFKANQIIETMTKGLEFLLKLAELSPIPAAAFRQFGDGIDLAMREIIRISTIEMRMGLSEAVFFAEAAGKIVAMIGGAVDALAKLKDFSAPASDVFRLFALAVTEAVGWISHVAGWFQDSAVAAAANFADGAGKVVAIIGTAVDAFAKLEGFQAPSIERFHQFALAVVSAVGWISHVAGWFRGVALDDATAFADAAGKIIGIIGGAVDAFAKLQDFKGIPGAAMVAFAQALLVTVQQMAWLATQWAPQVVAAAAIFAENAGKVVGIISAGVDGFLKLVDFKGVPGVAILAFTQALAQTIQLMAWLSQQWAPEAVAAAGVFAENAGRVVGILSAGVDGFLKLIDFKGIPGIALLAFTQALEQTIQQMAWLSLQWSPQMVTQAAVFADAAQRIVGVIGAAVEAFAKLADFRTTSAGVLSAFTEGLRGLLAEMQRQVLPAATDLGSQIMQGIAQGITSQIPAVLGAALAAIRAVVSAIRAELGIASPSTVFAGLGYQIPAGLAQGVAAGTPMVAGAVQSMGAHAASAGQTTYNTYNSYNLNYDGTSIPSTGSAAQDIRLLAMLQGSA